MQPLSIAALLCWIITLGAVEIGPVPVSRVSDGDTIVVRLDGQDEKARLVYIDTPESSSNRHGPEVEEGHRAAAALKAMLPVGTLVRLWGPDADLRRDVYGRLLVVVLIGAAGDDSVQERMVRAGWTPLWEKYGRADDRWRARLLAAQAEAEKANAGAWATAPSYMRDKGNETTAPKGKRVNDANP